MSDRCDYCGKAFMPYHKHYAFVRNGNAVVIHEHCKQKLFDEYLKRKNGII